MGHRNPACKGAEDHFGVGTDLMLGMGIGAQGKKMHQIVQVDFPVPLGVIAECQIYARQLAGEPRARRVDRSFRGALVQQLGISSIGPFGIPAQEIENAGRRRTLDRGAAALPVCRPWAAKCSGAGK